jgi:hypothetical protein
MITFRLSIHFNSGTDSLLLHDYTSYTEARKHAQELAAISKCAVDIHMIKEELFERVEDNDETQLVSTLPDNVWMSRGLYQD